MQLSPSCRMCGVKDDTVGHLLCECSKNAHMQYKNRHDNVARIVSGQSRNSMDLISQRNGMSSSQNR